MTIAAGFVCSDGLLFASDTMYSGPAKNTFGRKFWVIRLGTDDLVVFGGAGTQPGLKRTFELMEQALSGPLPKADVLAVIESALHYVNELQKPTERENERTYALVGLRLGGYSWIYENQGGGAALTAIDENSQCVGAGYSLGQYFARTLFRVNMPIRWAKVVAAHLIRQVKTHNDGYCGGDTHIIAVPTVGDFEFILDQAEIAELESYLAPLDEAVPMVLPDHTANDETLRLRLDTILTGMAKAAKATVVAVPTGYITMAGSSMIGGIPEAKVTYSDIRSDSVTMLPPGDPEDE